MHFIGRSSRITCTRCEELCNISIPDVWNLVNLVAPTKSSPTSIGVFPYYLISLQGYTNIDQHCWYASRGSRIGHRVLLRSVGTCRVRVHASSSLLGELRTLSTLAGLESGHVCCTLHVFSQSCMIIVHGKHLVASQVHVHCIVNLFTHVDMYLADLVVKFLTYVAWLHVLWDQVRPSVSRRDIYRMIRLFV